MTTLAEVRERDETDQEAMEADDTFEVSVFQLMVDRAFLLAEIDRLKELCERAAEELENNCGSDCSIHSPKLIAELREAAK